MLDVANTPFLSVIIPAFNEAQRLGPTLERVLTYLTAQPHASEIIVVDDGSSDDTGDLARRLLSGKFDFQVLRNEPNAGKAVSVKRGLMAGRGQVLLFSDADLSTPIEEAARLLAEIAKGADIAIASRQLPGAKLTVHQPWYRELAGRAFGWVNQLVLLPGIPDSQCGFKAFRREAVHLLLPHQRLSGWAFDAELLYIARRLGLHIAQVPVTWTNDPASKVHMVRDGLRMVLDLFRIRILHRDLGRHSAQ